MIMLMFLVKRERGKERREKKSERNINGKERKDMKSNKVK